MRKVSVGGIERPKQIFPMSNLLVPMFRPNNPLIKDNFQFE